MITAVEIEEAHGNQFFSMRKSHEEWSYRGVLAVECTYWYLQILIMYIKV